MFPTKGGAADPCPFLARGRGPSDGGTMWDAPQGFRGCLPPPPIWPETRLRLRDLSTSLQGETKRGAGTGCPGGTAFDLYACGAEQILDERSQVDLQLDVGQNVRT